MLKKTLALFDFDGTISNLDSVSEFIKFIHPRWRYFYIKIILSGFDYLRYRLGRMPLQLFKTKMLKRYFSCYSKSELIGYATRFVSTKLPKMIKISALERIMWHRKNGDDIYVVSASIDLLLQSWCESYKIKLITNQLVCKGNKYTGEFIMPDCNYEEKARRIKMAIKLEDYQKIFAYGDTGGDLAMLELATDKFFKYFN